MVRPTVFPLYSGLQLTPDSIDWRDTGKLLASTLEVQATAYQCVSDCIFKRASDPKVACDASAAH
jgi:hypothetical protein